MPCTCPGGCRLPALRRTHVLMWLPGANLRASRSYEPFPGQRQTSWWGGASRRGPPPWAERPGGWRLQAASDPPFLPGAGQLGPSWALVYAGRPGAGGGRGGPVQASSKCNCIWTLKRNCVKWAAAPRSAALFGVEICFFQNAGEVLASGKSASAWVCCRSVAARCP